MPRTRGAQLSRAALRQKAQEAGKKEKAARAKTRICRDCGRAFHNESGLDQHRQWNHTCVVWQLFNNSRNRDDKAWALCEEQAGDVMAARTRKWERDQAEAVHMGTVELKPRKQKKAPKGKKERKARKPSSPSPPPEKGPKRRRSPSTSSESQPRKHRRGRDRAIHVHVH